MLTQLKLRTIADLRADKEIRHNPDVVPETALYVRHDLRMTARLDEILGLVARAVEERDPRLVPVSTLGDFYAELILERTAEIAAVFRSLLERGTPLLFHCTRGQDRTGVIAALLLLWLGFSEDSVVEDYMKSRAEREDVELKNAARALDGLGLAEAVPAEMLAHVADVLAVKPEHGRRVLAAVVAAEPEGVDAYFERRLGLTRDDKERFEEALLTPPITSAAAKL